MSPPRSFPTYADKRRVVRDTGREPAMGSGKHARGPPFFRAASGAAPPDRERREDRWTSDCVLEDLSRGPNRIELDRIRKRGAARTRRA
ncbi:hypothetical protein ALC56_14832 [Trachymyrmex septentrionalis]|uniref:Uncharacterized protein n=1 Tax=Trachymyrmex septentrionalis TaxID=34720 RepID=A0A195ERZ0_9HYME|nr:hypothetical protein ALC56_14832 [Trachymyrmex septentrionalis]